MKEEKLSRKKFLSYSAAAGVTGALSVSGLSVLNSCKGPNGGEAAAVTYEPLQSDIPVYIPDLSGSKAVAGKPLKAGIIGCGSRGSGAALNFLNSADDVTISVMGDIFEDRLEGLRKHLKEQKGIEVKDSDVHYGFEAYKKVIDSDIDLVIIATPTVFHPDHLKYAVDQGKHVFCEKPAGVDPVGCKKVLAACKTARAKGISIVTGTQRHHDRAYVEGYKRVRDGYIGRIVSANVYWNQGGPWFFTRKPGMTDMEYMLRDFFSWNWLCGDHVLDQLVHNVDVFTWFSHLKPVRVTGMGSRLRRTTGDIYDNFSADIVYEGNVRVHAAARQIDDCANDIGETIFGTKGSWNSYEHAIRDLDGNIVWQYDFKKQEAEHPQRDPYVLEHMNLVNSIRTGKPICLAETTAISSLACIMARESAYTGKQFTWDDMMASELSLLPKKLHLGNVGMENFPVPIPGLVKSNAGNW